MGDDLGARRALRRPASDWGPPCQQQAGNHALQGGARHVRWDADSDVGPQLSRQHEQLRLASPRRRAADAAAVASERLIQLNGQHRLGVPLAAVVCITQRRSHHIPQLIRRVRLRVTR